MTTRGNTGAAARPAHVTASRRIWWLAGIVVVPVCVVLVVSVPWQVFLDRDIALNGRRVTATAVALELLKTRSGYVRNFDFRYTIEGREYAVWLGAPAGTEVGSKVVLVYAPNFPRHAVLPTSGDRPWDDGIALRLFTGWSLALVFGGAWLAGLRAARRSVLLHNGT